MLQESFSHCTLSALPQAPEDGSWGCEHLSPLPVPGVGGEPKAGEVGRAAEKAGICLSFCSFSFLVSMGIMAQNRSEFDRMVVWEESASGVGGVG